MEKDIFVLILILMEYSLTLRYRAFRVQLDGSLNPYSNGILPDSCRYLAQLAYNKCLNPYSNGILPDSQMSDRKANIYLS